MAFYGLECDLISFNVCYFYFVSNFGRGHTSDLKVMELYLLASLLVGLVSGVNLPGNYGTMEPTPDYGGEGYGTADVEYGGSAHADKKCYPTYETKFREACEDYSEKVCYTTQKESCTDLPGQKCKAIQTSKQERKCFDVNEMLCSLKENVKYEETPAVFTIQKCHKITERVCDTVYETEYTEKDDFQCITITNPSCGTKDYTVYDKTCRTVTHFDCKATGYADNDGYGSGNSNPYGDSYGSSNTGSYGQNDSSYGHTCTRTPETKCYTTPRTVSSQHCEDREERVCEKSTDQSVSHTFVYF